MKWRTEVKIPDNKGFINYQTRILTLGSCFSEEVGDRLNDAGFDIDINHGGILFHPVSILQLIQNALDGNIREEMIIERSGKYFHFGLHSSISAHSKEGLIHLIEELYAELKSKLLNTDRLFLTFGTAFLWRLKSNNAAVANCHKIPAEYFTKELADLQRIEEFSIQLFDRLFEINPNLEVLLTVSPVRHSKEGLHQNNLSKSTLHLYTSWLYDQYERISYFPSYELVIDELRDYRFFKEDLVHPNTQAIDFVFEKFRACYFDQKTSTKFELKDRLRKAENHKAMNPTNEESMNREMYIEGLKQKLENFK